MLVIFLPLLSVGFVVYILFCQRKDHWTPPGPWGFPIVGHLPLFGKHTGQTLLNWKQRYGPIMKIRLGRRTAIVLTDPKIIKEACNLPVFDGRAPNKFFNAVTNKKGVALSENPAAAEQRQFLVKVLKEFGYGRKAMEIKMQQEIVKCLDKIGESEGRKIDGKCLFSISSVKSLWEIMIGEALSEDEEELIHFAHIINQLTKLVTLREKLTLFWPSVAAYAKNFSGLNDRVRLIGEIYNCMRVKINQRKAVWMKDHPQNVTDAYLDKVEKTTDPLSSFHENNDFQAFTTGDIFIAAIEAVGVSLEWLIIYLASYPQVQRKLQQEIDEHLGPTRLPSLNDRPTMKYADRVVLELLRVATVTPLGAPRRTMDDTMFHGYKIRKGTTVFVNQYGVNHDDCLWTNPHEFNPDRFLDSKDPFLDQRENVISFGVGPRMCLGAGLARDQIFLYATSLCQRFTIVMDAEDNKAVHPVFGITLNPSEFQVRFISRHNL